MMQMMFSSPYMQIDEHYSAWYPSSSISVWQLTIHLIPQYYLFIPSFRAGIHVTEARNLWVNRLLYWGQIKVTIASFFSSFSSGASSFSCQLDHRDGVLCNIALFFIKLLLFFFILFFFFVHWRIKVCIWMPERLHIIVPICISTYTKTYSGQDGNGQYNSNN